MGELSPMHWALVLVVVLLLVGSKKLPDMARGLGQSMRILKAESRAMRSDGEGTTAGTDQGTDRTAGRETTGRETTTERETTERETDGPRPAA